MVSTISIFTPTSFPGLSGLIYSTYNKIFMPTLGTCSLSVHCGDSLFFRVANNLDDAGTIVRDFSLGVDSIRYSLRCGLGDHASNYSVKARLLAYRNSITDEWSVDSGKPRYLYHQGELYTKSLETQQYLCWLLLLLGYGFTPEDAILVCRAAQLAIPRGTWPKKYKYFSTLKSLLRLDLRADSRLFPRMCQKKLVIYPVLPSYKWILKVILRSVSTVQLRVKEADVGDLESQIRASSILARKTGTQLFINDHWKLAIKCGAYGVHLGQEDVQSADIEMIRQSGMRLGISTHGYYEILISAGFLPSYIALGHIFPTPTKHMVSVPQGLGRLFLYQRFIDGICDELNLGFPTVAIGGIDLNNAKEVMACGVSSIAVVRAITEATQLDVSLSQFSTIVKHGKERKYADTVGC